MAASLDHALSTSQMKVAEVWDVRRTIEMRTAALAARNATPGQAARIVALAEAMGDDERPHAETTEDDIDFHLAIAEASGNALFNQIVRSFVPLMRVAVPEAWRTRETEEQKREILERHKQLAWAIANQDPAESGTPDGGALRRSHWSAAALTIERCGTIAERCCSPSETTDISVPFSERLSAQPLFSPIPDDPLSAKNRSIPLSVASSISLPASRYTSSWRHGPAMRSPLP